MKSLLITLLVVAASQVSNGQILNVELSEMTKSADKVFVGVVSNINCTSNEKGLPVTVVSFQNIDAARTNGDYTVKYAGGSANGVEMWVSHTPTFEAGKKYMIFAADNNKRQFNPITGYSGLMEVIKDEVSDVEYLTLAGHCVTGIANDHIAVSSRKINHIRNGVPIFEVQETTNEVASPVDEHGHAAGRIEIKEGNETPLSLTAFKDLLAVRYHLTFTKVASTLGPLPQVNFAMKTTGGISVTKIRTVPITFEQLPSSSVPYYGLNNECINNWNNVMNIFQVTAGNSTYGQNGVDEFIGMASSANLSAAYGFTWSPGVLGVTFNFYSGNQIFESDVAINPSFTFNEDPWGQVAGTSFVYKTIATHEFGHAWGLMVGLPGGETYDYNIPTVMQGAAAGIYENGWGVHAADAINMRGAYSSQVAVPNLIDVGIESYYAVDGVGLKPATFSKSSGLPGEVVTISGMSVENMSNSTVNDVRVQFFLSTDASLSSNDYMMNTFGFQPMPAHSYNMTATYDVNVPAAPTGFYYLGAVIKYNTSSSDAIIGNNVTFLSNKFRVLPTTNVAGATNADATIQVAKLPAKGAYTLKLLNDLPGTVKLYNAVGQLMSTQDLTNTQIQLPDADGLYMLEVATNKGRKVFKLNNY